MIKPMGSGPYSLRRRLVWAVILAVTLVLVVLGISIQTAIKRSSGQEFDERLALQARVILAYADHEYAETGSVLSEAALGSNSKQAQEVIYQVWTTNGTAVRRSDGAPVAPLVPLTRDGFVDVRFANTDWRAYTLASHNAPVLVQIAELVSHRNLIAARARAAVLIPMLVALPLLAALVWWLTTAALRPVDKLARDIRDRSSGDVAPLDEHRMPAEITGLVLALNGLVARHGEALAREQRFTADAAHELRTPLAAVRAQAQVALRALDLRERQHALRQLITGVDRAGRLVTQLLSLARLEPASVLVTTATRGASDVLKDVLHDLEPDIERSGVAIEVVQSNIHMMMQEEPLYLLLRNLIDNSIQHSPANGVIRIVLREIAGRLEITISDQGPGIPASQRAAALDRFRRFSDRYDGSGLGLSIVKRVADLLDGTLELRDASPPPGLAVAVVLKPHPRKEGLSAVDSPNYPQSMAIK
ncbi:MAG TPA: ATP-binding protein [Steroidobacteraceae bacterium]